MRPKSWRVSDQVWSVTSGGGESQVCVRASNTSCPGEGGHGCFWGCRVCAASFTSPARYPTFLQGMKCNLPKPWWSGLENILPGTPSISFLAHLSPFPLLWNGLEATSPGYFVHSYTWGSTSSSLVQFSRWTELSWWLRRINGAEVWKMVLSAAH